MFSNARNAMRFVSRRPLNAAAKRAPTATPLATTTNYATDTKAVDADSLNFDQSIVEYALSSLQKSDSNPFREAFDALPDYETATLQKFLVDNAGQEFKYDSKYPDISIESLDAKYSKEFVNMQFYKGPAFEKAVKNAGYSNDDYTRITTNVFPTFVDAEDNFDWDAVQACFGVTPLEVRLWQELQDEMETFRDAAKQMIAENEVVDDKVILDWDYWAKALDPELANAYKQIYEETVQKLPKFETVDVQAVAEQFIYPRLERMKDRIIDAEEQLLNCKEDLMYSAELRHQIEVVGDLSQEELLNKYFPVARNEMDLEYEAGNYDFEYEYEHKVELEGVEVADMMPQMNKENMQKRREVDIKATNKMTAGEVTESTGSNAHQKITSMLDAWAGLDEKLKRLEGEVNSMKHLQEDDHADAAEGVVTKDISEQEQKENEIFEPLAKAELTAMHNLDEDYWDKLEEQDRLDREEKKKKKD